MNTVKSANTTITYIGHSTLLIEMNGVRLLTDPVFSQRVAFLHRHSPPVQEAWLHNIDLILLSHLHGDHVDLPSLRKLCQLNPEVRILAPRDKRYLMMQDFGPRLVDEVEVGATKRSGPLRVQVTQAQHGQAKYFFQRDIPCVGYVIQGDHSIYFAGDTDLFPQMAELAGTLDLALLPVWGWGPTLGAGHLDPQAAAQALTLLQPRYAIPIHWGTFVPWGLQFFRPRFLVYPPQDFARFAADLAPTVEVRILAHGEHFAMPLAL